MADNLKVKRFRVPVPTSTKLCFILAVILSFTLPCFGHLASILEGSEPGGYIFRVHPRQGETKPPFLNHARVSRGPSKLSAAGEPRLRFLKPPSFTHKYLPNARLSKFYQNSPAVITSSSQVDQIGERSKPVNFNPWSTEVMDMEGLSKEEPTFTPYIGARALSNMDKFFQHLRENLEALQKDEDIGQLERRGEIDGDDYDEVNGPQSSPDKSLPAPGYHSPTGADWKPIASGDLGLKKVRSFFPLARPTESRRMGTNFGIGRKRRR